MAATMTETEMRALIQNELTEGITAQLLKTTIQQMAEESAAEQIAATPEPETKVRVGTATGRGVTVAKRKVGVITDPVAFFAAVKEDADIKEALQKKANALARAGTALAGMEISTQ